MSVRTPWQDLYAVQQECTVASWPTFEADTKIGIEGIGPSGLANGKFIIPITEHAHLNPGASAVEHELAFGQSDRSTLEYNTVVTQPPTTTLTMPLTSYNLSLFAWLLFQTGTSETLATTVQTMTCVPYTEATTEVYAHVARLLGNYNSDLSVDTRTHIMRSCICNSLSINGEEGDILMLTAELMGTQWLQCTPNVIANAAHWSSLNYSTKTPLKWQNMTTKLGNAALDIPGFSCTISNNAQAKYYAGSTIKRFVLGRLGGEGSIFIPWSDTGAGENDVINMYTSDADTVIMVYNTDGATTENTIDIKANIKFTEVNFEGDVELGSQISFQTVDDGTNTSIVLKCGYRAVDLHRNVP